MSGNTRKLPKDDGFGSLYSMLISLTLSAIPLSLLFSVNSVSKQIDSQVYALESENLLFHYLDKIVADTGQGGVRLIPRMHRKGLITLTSGEPLLISKSPDLFPDRISDAISWIETDFRIALSVIRIAQNGLITSCFLHGGARSIARETTRFLVITRDGSFETEERFPHSSARQSCPALELIASESILAGPKADYYLPGAAVIIPIKRINTIYRDSLKRLRLLTNEGNSVTSNQPLRANVPIMRFENVTEFNQAIALTVTLQSAAQSSHERSAYRIYQLLPPSGLTLIGNSINAR